MGCDCDNDCEPVWQAEIQQGETFTFSADLTDSADAIVNITGCAATFTLKKTLDSAAVVTLSVGSGLTVTGASGRIDGAVDAASTATLKGDYFGSLKIVLAGGETTVIPGKFEVCRTA